MLSLLHVNMIQVTFQEYCFVGKKNKIRRNPTIFLIANTKYIARYWKFKIPKDNLGVSESPSHAVADPEEGEFEGDVRPLWERERERGGFPNPYIQRRFGYWNSLEKVCVSSRLSLPIWLWYTTFNSYCKELLFKCFKVAARKASIILKTRQNPLAPAELRPPTHNPGSAPARDMLLVWHFHTSVARNLHFARILFHRTIFDSHMKINFTTVSYSQYYRNGRYNELLILLRVCVSLCACNWKYIDHDKR